MTLPMPRKMKITRYSGGLSKFRKIRNPIKLSANESALGPSPRAIKAFIENKNKIFKYPQSDASNLRNVLSKKFNIDKIKIICGSGSDQIIDLVCQLFINPGDEVVVTQFGFIMYQIYASIYQAKIVKAKEINFKASVNEILNKITKKTKIVFIANPNNPTGTYLSKNEMIRLRKNLRKNILLVVDDAYFEFVNKKDYASGLDLFKYKKNVLITRTFSKIYGLAGLRLGWGYASRKIITKMYLIKPPFNVNNAALSAGIEAIKDSNWVKKAIKHNKLWSKKIYFVLKKYNIEVNETATNFFLMNFNNTKINSHKVFNKLASKGLILRKMIQYKIPNSLRLTIGNAKSNKLFIKNIKGILK